MYLLTIAGPDHTRVGIFTTRAAAESAVVTFVNGSYFGESIGRESFDDENDSRVVHNFRAATAALAAADEFRAGITIVDPNRVYDLGFDDYGITAGGFGIQVGDPAE